jgi:hypothetical protein
MKKIKPYWHDHNPWRDRLVYVPLRELAECGFAIGAQLATWNGQPLLYDVAHMLDHWSQFGRKLDAYILTGQTLAAGVRYGPEGPDYLSPGFHLPKLAALLKKHRKQ